MIGDNVGKWPARATLQHTHTHTHTHVCTSLQTDNHATTPPLSFYRPDALATLQTKKKIHTWLMILTAVAVEIHSLAWIVASIQ